MIPEYFYYKIFAWKKKKLKKENECSPLVISNRVSYINLYAILFVLFKKCLFLTKPMKPCSSTNLLKLNFVLCMIFIRWLWTKCRTWKEKYITKYLLVFALSSLALLRWRCKILFYWPFFRFSHFKKAYCYFLWLKQTHWRFFVAFRRHNQVGSFHIFYLCFFIRSSCLLRQDI